jgi:tetratricopeptide (TPR) repeat protein
VDSGERRNSTVENMADTVDPRFALQVNVLLESGNAEQALSLAQAGVEQYPWYPTGMMLLSKCYEATGRPFDALLAMRKVEALLPDAPLIKEALARLELPQAQSYEQSMQNEEAAAPPEAPAREAPASQSQAPQSMDELVEKLQSAGPVRPDPQQPPAEPGPETPAEGEPVIASPTVAEIFVQQGEYGEALRTYRKMLREHPEDFEKYGARIDEIEEMIRKQIFE